jgi:hypothetical protein
MCTLPAFAGLHILFLHACTLNCRIMTQVHYLFPGTNLPTIPGKFKLPANRQYRYNHGACKQAQQNKIFGECEAVLVLQEVAECFFILVGISFSSINDFLFQSRFHKHATRGALLSDIAP